MVSLNGMKTDTLNILMLGASVGEFILNLLVVLVASLIFSGPLLGVGLYFRSKYKKADRIHKLMADTETTAIGSLTPGPVEIRGRVVSTLPPAPSPWSQQPCVFYHFHVEEQRSTQSEHGHHSTYWVDYINDRSSDSFPIEDGTGSVEIAPKEGEFKMNTDFAATSGSFNDAPENLRTLINNRYGRDTQGLIFNKSLRYKESMLENGDEVYVFGEVRQDQGRFIIGAGEMPLIISENGEAAGQSEYASKARKNKTLFMVFLIIGGLIAVVFLCIGIFAAVAAMTEHK